jgi:hypothetical protein
MCCAMMTNTRGTSVALRIARADHTSAGDMGCDIPFECTARRTRSEHSDSAANDLQPRDSSSGPTAPIR